MADVAESDDKPSPRWRRAARLAAWATLTAGFVTGGVAWLLLARDDRPATFAVGWMLLTGAALAAAALLLTTPPTAIRLSPRAGKRLLLAASLALVATSLATAVPVHDAGVLRHHADGAAWLAGRSPYAVGSSPTPASPDDPFAAAAATLDAAAPKGRSPHGPVAQAWAGIARAVESVLPPGHRQAGATTRPAGTWREAMADLPWWRRAFVWRLGLAAAYLATLVELAAWLRQRGRSVWWLAAFAWPPAAWHAATAAGDPAVLGALALVAGLRRADLGRPRRTAVCLALAGAVWPVAWAAVPLAARRVGGGLPRRRLWAWAVGITLLVYLPFLLPQGGWRALPGILGHALNPPATGAVDLLMTAARVPGSAVASLTAAAALATIVVTGILAWRRDASPATAAYAIFLALFLATGTGPAMLAWPLAVAPVAFGLTAVAWAGLVAGPVLVPAAVAAVLELLARRRRRPVPSPVPAGGAVG